MPARFPAPLRKPPARLEIAPVAPAYEVGQPVRVRLVATGLKDATIRQARAELVMRIWLRKPRSLGEGPSSREPQRTVTGPGLRLGLPDRLPAGARAECEAVLPTDWVTAPSGGQPPGRRIEFAVHAELSFTDGTTARSEAPVRLVSGPSLYRAVEGTQHRLRFRRCDLELIAPVMRARPGETVRGTLRVVPRSAGPSSAGPHRPVRARAVALLVARRQSVPRRRYWTSGQGLARDVVLDGAQEFPFEVQLGCDVPTMITPHLSVRWYLRAVVRYGQFARDSGEWELNVYTGPP
jgi:hypothetical protein